MYQERRLQLAKRLSTNSIALFFSGKAPYKVGDEKYKFSVDRNFYWLSGLDREHMILLLANIEDELQEYLFIERYDEEMAKWIGGNMRPAQAQTISGIANVFWIDEIDEILHMLFTRMYPSMEQIEVYADFTKQEPSQADSEASLFTRQLLQRYPYLTLLHAGGIMAELRMVKDEDEIHKLKKAIAVTKEGIERMMSYAHAGIQENELEAHFDFVLKCQNCEHSFPSIIAGGKNAAILHYEENNQKIKDRSLVLCDLGASYQYMNADITRTFPVNGHFTKRQRQIYDIVLQGNKLIIELARPKKTLKELNDALLRYYKKELEALGLLSHGKQVADYYWHGVSHMLGLETHDVSLPGYELRPGNVFTIEPGLYIEEEQIGIRIEDNVLITEDGCINLSADIIKEADDIEAFMATHHKEA